MTPPGGPPAFSVIVPVHRDWDRIPGLLATLAAQRPPAPRFEILIVNNDAPAAPPPLDLPANARILPCATPGSYAARNAGAAAARGDWLVFTDADCRPEPDWLAALARAASETPGTLLAGPVRMTATARPGAWETYDLLRGIPQARYVSRGYAATANLAAPAGMFRILGGFDPGRRSGGDAEFCRRAGRAGHRLRLVPDAVVAHPARASWAELALKARRMKGGQIAAGPLPRRVAWILATLAPPVRDIRLLLAAPHPWRSRIVAATIRLRLWTVELAEIVRLLAGGAPERR
jgi:glycosyltransferase involved in cell wall biosynthesis